MIAREGQQLGNYRLLRLLGQGDLSEVYLGEHVYLKTQAAIKVLQMQLAEEELESFLTEARLIAGLVHPHIIRVLDFGVEEKTPFLILSYAPNGTLRQRHPSGTPLPVGTMLSYVEQVSAALQYAHEKKLIHRNIRPENMLLGSGNEVLLSDFGIALIAQTFYQRTQKIVGTMTYMAPEQIQGKPEPASDQYALGVVVYEWLCGNPPFHGSAEEIANQHLHAPPPPLHDKVATMTPEIEEVVQLALAKDPQRRFGSMKAFANALDQACQSELPTIRARPFTSQPETLPSPSPEQAPPTPVTVTKPAILPTAPALPERRLSRRAILLGVGGLAAGLAVAGGGLTLLLRSQGSHTSTAASPTPTPTPSPPGTPIITYRGHILEVFAVAWSPDGKRIASGSADKTVQVWDATTGNNVLTYRGHKNRVLDVAWSPDGKYIASAGYDNTVQVWNAAKGGKAIFTYGGHFNLVYYVEWLPGGKLIASVSNDLTVQIWDATTGGHVLTFTYAHLSDQLIALIAALSLDGKRIAVASTTRSSNGGSVKVQDISTGNTILTYSTHFLFARVMAWSPDGQRIATGSSNLTKNGLSYQNGTVQIWDATTGHNILSYSSHSDLIMYLKWSPDGKRIAIASSNISIKQGVPTYIDNIVQVLDTTTGNLISTYSGHSQEVLNIDWSPDGQRIASASFDQTVQVWWAV